MSLIKSISGIRGTIGGAADDGLNPIAVTRFTAAYASFIKESTATQRPLIVVGRDARMSGEVVRRIVTGTLMSMGCQIEDKSYLRPTNSKDKAQRSLLPN